MTAITKLIPRQRRIAAFRSTAEERKFLKDYEKKGYAVRYLTVDVVALTIKGDELAVLLVKRNEAPYEGRWALPGGFVRDEDPPVVPRDEDLPEAVLRELGEETGLGVHFRRPPEQFRTYARPQRDPRGRVVSVAHLALEPNSSFDTLRAGSDAREAVLWPASELRNLGRREGLAFDHADIINDGVKNAREKLERTSIATDFLPDSFTLLELRLVYQAVWGVKLDAANFRRKVEQTDGFVVATGERTRAAHGGRPAMLYNAASRDLVELHPPIRPS